MSEFFIPDMRDTYVGLKRQPLRRFLLRVFNIALAGLLTFTVFGSAAGAIRLVFNF